MIERETLRPVKARGNRERRRALLIEKRNDRFGVEVGNEVKFVLRGELTKKMISFFELCNIHTGCNTLQCYLFDINELLIFKSVIMKIFIYFSLISETE